ncbi:serine/threonine/tyrosine-protein kinase HT1-like [Wolffia australiana]
MASKGEGNVSWVTRSAFSSTVFHRPAEIPLETRPSFSGSVRLTPQQLHRHRTNKRPAFRGCFFNYFRKTRVAAGEDAASLNRLSIGSRISGVTLRHSCSFLYRGVYGEQPVAVKIATPPSDDAVLAASLEIEFLREAHFLSRLNHPNVIKVFLSFVISRQGIVSLTEEELSQLVAAGREQKVYSCLAYEFRHGGGSLKDLIRRSTKPMDLRKIVRIAAGIARGMEHVHEKGMVHRKLRPENILIEGGPSSPSVIVDGFWGACEEEREGSPETGVSCAPKMNGEIVCDRMEDVRCFGELLYEMFYGIAPLRNMLFPTEPESVTEEITPARQAKHAAALERLIAHCMTPSSVDRPEFSWIARVLDKLKLATDLQIDEDVDLQALFTSERLLRY